ncbi:MAG: alpha/beta fold hydrolase [Dehalococcoidia bacterium]|nr:MAG: alpha/beta fold hydrolase [Dehalococcoidia bacterium]
MAFGAKTGERSTMTLETLDGVKLFYETHGEKGNAPVVLVHGLGADHRMWQPQTSKYPSEGLFLIVPDVRGHGESSKVKHFRINDCARDLAELVQQMGVEKVSLIGVSLGGLIVQQFALDFPDKVEKLVIADSFSVISGLTEKTVAWVAATGLRMLPRSLMVKSFGAAYKGEDKSHVRRYFVEITAKADLEQLRLARDEVNRFNVVARLGEIRAPALVLVGDLNPQWFIRTARTTADGISGSRFKLLQGGMDPSNLVVAEVFDKETLTFLKEERSSTDRTT